MTKEYMSHSHTTDVCYKAVILRYYLSDSKSKGKTSSN